MPILEFLYSLSFPLFFLFFIVVTKIQTHNFIYAHKYTETQTFNIHRAHTHTCTLTLETKLLLILSPFFF